MGEHRRNLTPRDPLLLILHLPLEILPNRVAQFFFGAEVADLLQEFLGQFGQFKLLDFQHFEFEANLLASQVGVRRIVAQRDLGRAAIAFLRPLHQFGEAFEPRVAEAQRRPDPQHSLALVRELFAVVRRSNIDRNVVAVAGFALVRHQLAVAREHLLELLVDVGIREIADRPIELQAPPLRQVELGPHLDRELERHRSFFGHLDRFQVEIRLADRREALLFADLLQAIEQQTALHLVGNFIAKAMLDDLARRATNAEAGHGGRGHHLAEGVVEVSIDVLARDRHRHVPFAGARAGHLNVEFQGLIRRRLVALHRHGGRVLFLVYLIVFGTLAGHVPDYPQKCA